MAAESRPVTTEHFAYLRERTIPEDAFLADLKRAALEAGLPQIWIGPEQAAFLRVLLSSAAAREVIEVGTLGGYSAIQMARALGENGRVRTIELDPDHANFAESWIARSDVAGQIEVHRGAGSEVLPRFAADSADAAFIDADKVSYRSYFDECLRIVRPGGLVIVDNVFAFGHLLDLQQNDPSVVAVREFNDYVAGLSSVQGIIIPIGDGCWVGVKQPTPTA